MKAAKAYSATFLVDRHGFLELLDSLICRTVEANKNPVVNIGTDTV